MKGLSGKVVTIYGQAEIQKDLMDAHAARAPDARALACGGRELTWRALVDRIDRVAAAMLAATGIPLAAALDEWEFGR